MLRFYDATGKGHLGQATIKRSTGVNGSISLSGTIFDGQEVIQGLDYGWRLFFDDQYFAVTYRKLNDQDKTVEFDAIQQFFWDFSKTSLYTQSSGSHTFEWYLGQLFQDSGYTYDVQGTVLALEKDNWGMKNKLDLFNDIIKQADVEFEVSNKNIIIRQQIGSDLTGIVRQGINLANLIEETDISNFATYIKGYGKFVDENDHSKGRLEAEYTSPLAQVYGKLEMDPYVNESFSVASSFKSELKNKVDATYSVSLKLDIYDLENAGYPSVASPQVGDWIMAIDESLNFQKRIRIIKVDEEFDSVGKRIGYTATCGDLSSADSYQSSLGQLADKVEQVQNDVSLIVQTAANGYNRIYRGKDDPRTLQFKDLITGDSYYQTNGDQVTFWQWDGTRWVKVVDDMTGKEVSDKVDTAMQEMAEKEAELNQHTIDISQIKTDITQAENDIEQARQDASADLASFQVTVNADIDEAKQQATDAYTTATSIDAKAQQALNSATEAVTNTVNLQTTVDDLNGEMSSKADQETVDTLDKTVKNQSTLINQNAEGLKSKADSSVVDEINKTISVNSIEIEQNAKAIEGKANSVDLNKISGDLTTLTNNFNVTSSGFSADISAVKTRLGDAESGLETAKVDIKATANDLKVNYTKTTDEHDYVNSQIKQSADKLEASVASVSDKIDANQTDTDSKIAALQIEDDHIKQTVSNKADTSYVDQKANQITSTVGNKADISYVDQQDKKIQSTVASKADASQITQLSNQINLKVDGLPIAGYNLVPNSGDPQDTSNWQSYIKSGSGGIFRTLTHNFFYNGSRNMFILTTKSVEENYFWSSSIKVKSNTDYTLTFDVFADGNVRDCDVWFNGTDGTNAVNKLLIGKTSAWSNSKDQRVSITFNTGNMVSGVVRFDNNGSKTEGTICGLYVGDITLVEGRNPAPWMPADDIVSQINIDESGVLIQGKKIMIDGDATIKNAVIKSSMIDTLDASKITAGTLNAANVNIINLNVSKLVGDKTNFVQSAWNGVSQSVMISPAGLLSLGLSGFVSLTETGMNTFANVGDNYELVGNFQSATVAGTNSTNGSLVSIEPSGDFIGFGQRTSVKDPYSMVFTYWRNAGAGYKKGLNSTEDIYINSAKTLYAKKWGTIDAAKNAYVELGATSINKAGNYPVLGNQGLSSGFAFQGSHVWMLSGTKDLYDMTGTIKGFSGIQGKTILLPTEIPGSGQYAGLVKSYISIKLA